MQVGVGDELDCAVRSLIVKAVETAILPRFGQLHESDISEKTPGELVTVADRECEALLSAGLSRICPDARIVGEEACAADESLLEGLDDGRIWLVDPLDGTANFASGKGPFGVIIALADQGEIVAGWIYEPLLDRMCFAANGGGAYTSVDGESAPVQAAPPRSTIIATLATQFMPAPIREAVTVAASEFELQPIPRCAAAHYPALAFGTYQLALFQRTLPWDHAAGALFLTEAGAHVARWNGDPYIFHDGGVGILAASDRETWERGASAIFAGDDTKAYALELASRRSAAPSDKFHPMLQQR
jgi:fructose-1,6-bisphosphatase/inositol monophosphatase family enzyme